MWHRSHIGSSRLQPRPDRVGRVILRGENQHRTRLGLLAAHRKRSAGRKRSPQLRASPAICPALDRRQELSSCPARYGPAKATGWAELRYLTPGRYQARALPPGPLSQMRISSRFSSRIPFFGVPTCRCRIGAHRFAELVKAFPGSVHLPPNPERAAASRIIATVSVIRLRLGRRNQAGQTFEFVLTEFYNIVRRVRTYFASYGEIALVGIDFDGGSVVT